MGSISATFPFARMAGVGAVVFLANAALLVLQLVASRLLAPFIYSDLYTWTAIIGVFLTGIALGNAYGGRLADRYPSPKTLAAVLLLGALAALWMALAPLLFKSFYTAIPHGIRIPLLSAILCLPAGFVLSLLTPLSIKLGLPDVSKTGRVAGLVFALSTLGCLLGNYVTGFYLVPMFMVNTLVFVSAGALAILALGVFVVLSVNPPAPTKETIAGAAAAPNLHAFKSIRQAFAIVFLASFCGMTLELTASRVIAEKLGVSLFTWTGIIGVMLAGTALGNLSGGILADRANSPRGLRKPLAWLIAILGGLYLFALAYKGLWPLLVAAKIERSIALSSEEAFLYDGNNLMPNDPLILMIAMVVGVVSMVGLFLAAIRLADDAITPRFVLAGTLIAAGGGTVCIFITRAILTHSASVDHYELINQVLVWSFSLFFLPMFTLGMISPQVIRLAVPDVAHVGQVAGRVYAWSTAGAIAGTFATGYLLISALGVDRVILVSSAVLVCLGCAMLKWFYARVGLCVAGAGLLFSLLPEDWPLAIRILVALAVAALSWLDRAMQFGTTVSRAGSLAQALIDWKRDQGIESKEASQSIFIYAISIVLGGITGGFILLGRTNQEEEIAAIVETNYYKIKVKREFKTVDDVRHYTGELSLYLDHLLHSSVFLDNPSFIHYEHEYMQMEFLRAARAGTTNPKMLVIGGGGYTFPRYAKTLLPETEMDVVEIDPGVTRVAYEHLGLKKELGIRDFNMDGRQFVAESAAPGSYDLIVQDAVNDLSVPSHLLTKEYNDAVKTALKPDGVYLLTIIDEIEHGKLWRASMATLKGTFAYVTLLSTAEVPEFTPGMSPSERESVEKEMARMAQYRQVYVIYASDKPLDVKDLHEKNVRVANSKTFLTFHTHAVQDELLKPFLEREPGVILTDQYAPVDNLMADVFRRRNKW